MDLLHETSTSTELPEVFTGIPKIQFSWYDYALFAFMLLGSVLVGIYFGCFGNKQSTATDYLMGGKKMKVLPVALSMVASAISGFAILSVPVDIYLFGANFALSIFSLIIVAIFTYNIYLPVFYKLQLTSTYEYLEIRFNRSIRMVASVLFMLNLVLYMPIVIYVPALAFTQATDINTHLVTPVLCGICVFYTTIGGLKAVVWTDTFQFTAMLGAMGAICYLGIVHAGGFANIWNISMKGGRLDLDPDINPLKRDTVWAALIGLSFNWIGHVGISQGSVQKFLSLPSMSDCKKTTIIKTFGMMLNKAFIVLTGLTLYTVYHDCDPITSKQIEKADQIIPYFVLDVAHKIPGLPGLFIAGVFCASLSTLSALLNCISGIFYEDFLKRFMPEDITQKTVSNILKTIVLVAGVISTSLVFVVQHLGNLFPIGMKLTALAQGPLIGIFTLGMMFPKANAKGAMLGGLTSIACLTWMLIGASYYQSKGILRDVPKPLSIEGCQFPVNVTLPNITQIISDDEQPFFIYRISYYYYSVVGAMLVIIVGAIGSYLTRCENDPPVDKDLITPIMHFLLPQQENLKADKSYYSINKALHLLKIETDENNEPSQIKR